MISLRDPLDGNFWHVRDDLLSRLLLLNDHGVPRDIPLLVSPRLAASPWFASAQRRGQLALRTWVVHDRLIRADRVLMGSRGSLRDDAATRLQALLASRPRTSQGSRVLLVRGPGRGRYLHDQQDLVAALPGWTVVDAEMLSYDRQVALFEGAEQVVGVHGAGLTGLVHRAGAPLRVVELFPADFVHPHFAHLCRANGAAWSSGRRVVGTPLDERGGFRVDPDQVLAALER